MLRRCLQKDRAQRLRDVGDARQALEDAGTADVGTSPLPPRSRRRARAATIAVGAAALGALASWAVVRSPTAPERPALRLEIPAPVDSPVNLSTTTSALAISRDGRRVAWVGGTSSSGGPLTVRDMGELAPRTITDVAMTRELAFSPDGARLVFQETVIDGGLRKIPVGAVPR